VWDGRSQAFFFRKERGTGVFFLQGELLNTQLNAHRQYKADM